MKKKRTNRGFAAFLAAAICASLIFSDGALGSTRASASAAEAATGQNGLLSNGSFEDASQPSSVLDGWTLGSGYRVIDSDQQEGSNALSYSGTEEGTAQADNITLEANTDYLLSAWMKKSADSDTASVAVDGTAWKLDADKSGDWEYYSVSFNSGESASAEVILTAKGDVCFDSVAVREVFSTAVELVSNGGFENGAAGWSGSPTVADASASGGTGSAFLAPGTFAVTDQTVNVQTNTWYIYSADICRAGNGRWTYVDMYPTAENMRLRGYQTGAWEHVAGLWYSGSHTSTQVRIVSEGNWDNATSSADDGSMSMVDNVSLVKADVQDNLIPDANFSQGGWLLNGNGAASSVKGKSDSSSFQSVMTDGTAGDAIAVANGGNPISITPNTQYVFSAWVYVTGAPKTVTAYIDMGDAADELQLESTTYNQNGYRDDYWVLLSGFWYSGSHTEVTVRAVIDPVTDGAVNTAYIDEVSLRQAAVTMNGENLLSNGGFEDFCVSPSADHWALPDEGTEISGDAYSGKYALRLSGTNREAVSDSISLAANTEYTLSGWVYADDGSTAEISALNGAVSAAAAGTGEWEYVSVKFNSGEATSTTIKALTKTGSARFDLLYLAAAADEYNQGGAVLSPTAERYTLASQDTSLTVAVEGNKQYIEVLKETETGYEWVSADEAQEIPLVASVNGEATDWKYQGSSVDTSDGELLSLTFTNAEPAMELTAYWQVYPDGEGPVQYWATIQNNSGGTLTFQYSDIVSGDLVVTTDGACTLTRFGRCNYAGTDLSSRVYENEITPGFHSLSQVENQWNSEGVLPFQVIESENGHGMYYGYYWSFGQMTVDAQNDPNKVRIRSGLGDSGTVTRKVAAGDENGDGTQDADLDLTIPGMFFGVYKGSVDNGSNRMKDWFWKHKMTETMRENENEPLIELHLPYNSEEEWTEYLNTHDVASWGVQLLKQDYWWMTPNSPPSDSSFHSELHSLWNPYSTKWPNGMILGNLAHSYGLQMSLYMCNTYQDTPLTDWTGRVKDFTALATRLKDWNIDYYRSDFSLEGPDGSRNYAAHEGFLWVLDSLLSDSDLPNFHYEHCSGGGCLKDFTSLERMTFMTTEDSGRALQHRIVAYANSYMINPVQLKVDNSIDWAPLEGSYTDQDAWDYYSLRTGLMGAMMVCPSTELSGFTDHQIEVAKETYHLYNTKQREILRNCDVYHILPSPDGVNWDGLEYFNDNIEKGSIVLFRPGDQSETEKVIYPDGLQENTVYSVTFEDDTDLNGARTGKDLMENGISVRMGRDYDSEVIWLEAQTVPVSEITVSGANELQQGKTTTLTASVAPENATDRTVTWSSDNSAVAAVDSNGVVTGISAGTAKIRATANDGSGVYGELEITVKQAPAAPVSPAITTETLPDGKVGTVYSGKLEATGTAPITFTVTAGNLPDGLTLTDGVFSGTPTKAGTYKFTVTAENTAGKVSKLMTIVIQNADGTAVKTGDSARPLFWSALFVAVSAAGYVVLQKIKKFHSC